MNNTTYPIDCSIFPPCIVSPATNHAVLSTENYSDDLCVVKWIDWNSYLSEKTLLFPTPWNHLGWCSWDHYFPFELHFFYCEIGIYKYERKAPRETAGWWRGAVPSSQHTPSHSLFSLYWTSWMGENLVSFWPAAIIPENSLGALFWWENPSKRAQGLLIIKDY